MQLSSTSFADQGAIPEEFAFARPAESDHVELSQNRNPELSWSEPPPCCSWPSTTEPSTCRR